jgi:hypothetical protein
LVCADFNVSGRRPSDRRILKILSAHNELFSIFSMVREMGIYTRIVTRRWAYSARSLFRVENSVGWRLDGYDAVRLPVTTEYGEKKQRQRA